MIKIPVLRWGHPYESLELDNVIHFGSGETLAKVSQADSPERKIAQTEYMFPYVTVVQCPQAEMIEKISQTLVCSAITNDKPWSQQLIDATHIDRLNIGPIPTIKLDWLQPHEGNIVDFLFRARAFQTTPQ